MTDHDPMCPYRNGRGADVSLCPYCPVIAWARADEQEKIHQQIGGVSEYVSQMLRMIDTLVYRLEAITSKVEEDRANLTLRMAEPHEWDHDQIDQWASERVALNRVLAIMKEEQ
jgi:hypothetical protein